MDEILTQEQQTPEVGVGEGAVGVDTPAEGSQVAEAQTEVGAGSAEPAISIDENGELQISDEMLSEVPSEPLAEALKVRDDPKEPESEEQKAPEVYTPEDMAKAFIENTIDVKRLPPEMQAYYKAINAEQQRRSDILNINKPQQAQPIVPIAPPQMPKITSALSPAEFAELQAHGKVLAAKMLGVAEADFDEFNPNHQQAQKMAMDDIRVRAKQIEVERAQAQMQAYQQQQFQIRQQNLQAVVQEFQKNANWQDIDQNFYPQWRSRLDQRTGQVVDGILAEGNVAKLQQLMGHVVKAYEASKTPVKAVKAPPQVMSSSQSTDIVENKGMADTSKLGDMTPEEKAAWFIQNKFV